ncbi:substrate-binding domain-containing protein [Paenibacillus sp. NEAU-GSW1]|uniref:substrate-binding domain-containing protein n=1 Tax=Paenibacillus sp. NEAU-GSW1 TaxID=2682486 RepID=UPI0012E0FA22|nr:substrate-binding domain-containing protein [Paenibacillus sp. NEAU-GSW1]MUT66610.1 LacI family DNA-binding transcriptional regulator [Paenibacillus sp. NEAU-GSW1]
MSNNITMKDIANRLGVSSVTVSKALGDKEGVSDELKQKIKELAQEMGYRYNTLAKAMKDGVSYNIGVIIAERFTGMAQSFYLQFYQHVAKSLEEYQYSGILHILHEKDEAQQVLPRIYYEKKVDGFIVLGQLDKHYIEALQNSGLPLVLLDFYTDKSDVDYIITDNFYCMYELTNYLISNGHRHIAFVGSLYSTSSIQDRFLGYYKSMLEHRLTIGNGYVIEDRDEKGRYIDFVLPENLPTAFVCNCDMVAFNLINDLKKRGIKVPEECSVVGFDNDIYSTITEPPLTTVEVNMQEMAQTAVKKVIKKVNNKTTNAGRVLIKGKIVYRDSVQNIN